MTSGARALGLNVSDAEVIKRITDDASFKGPNGQFDRFRFEQIIRQAGYTEARFISEQRRQMLRRQLATTIVSGDVVSKAMIEAANRYQNEQRAIEYLLLDRSKAGEIEPPTAEVLAKYFDERKILFRAPEYRKLLIVSLIPSEQGAVDRDFRRGPQGCLREPPLALRYPGTPAHPPDRIPDRGRRQDRRPNAWPRANRLPTSPKSVASPRRISISAR